MEVLLAILDPTGNGIWNSGVLFLQNDLKMTSRHTLTHLLDSLEMSLSESDWQKPSQHICVQKKNV